MFLVIILFIILLIIVLYINNNKIDNLRLAHEYHNKFDGINAIKYYNNCIKDGNIIALINLGSIYHYGINNSIDVNLLKAFQCYYNLLQLLKDKNDIYSRSYKFYAFNKINQIYDELNEMPYNQIQPKQIKLTQQLKQVTPTDESDSTHRRDEFMMNSILDDFDKNTLFSNQQIRQPTQPTPVIINRINIDDFIDNRNIEANRNLNRNNTPPIRPPIIYNQNNIDHQSVHDSFINNTVSNSINNLKNETNKLNNNKLTFNDVSYIINTKINKNTFDQKKKVNITKVLQRIKESDFKSIKNNMSLSDAISLVSNRINTKCIENNKPELMDDFISNLLIELNDCVENEQIVCPTGIFNRVVNSINMLDENVNIKSSDALNSEIMAKCVAIRSKLETDLDSESDELPAGGDSTHRRDDFDNILKQKIKEELNKDYIESKILTQEQLNDITKIWIDHI